MRRHLVSSAFLLSTIGPPSLSAEMVSAIAMPAVAGGESHYLFLEADGTVLAHGSNTYGQLGQGDWIAYVRVPTPVSALSDVAQIAAGDHHSLAIKRDGTLWSWGSNALGQLALGDNTIRISPTNVNGIDGVIAVVAGRYHSLALTKDGTVWSAGGNDDGQLGLGDRVQRNTISAISGLRDIVQVSTGNYHTLAIRRDGTLWAWGNNQFGQLGLGDGTTRYTPNHVSQIDDVIAVAAGGNHSLALKRDGTVYAWGANSQRQLGLGDTLPRQTPQRINGLTDVVTVSAGRFSSYAIARDGGVYVWGDNAFGELGLGDTAPRSLPTSGSLSGAIAIAGGAHSTVAVKADGSGWAAGYNSEWQLGLNDQRDRTTPTQIAAAQHVPTILTPSVVDFGSVDRGVPLDSRPVAFQVAAGEMNLQFDKVALSQFKAPGLFSGYSEGTCTSRLLTSSDPACEFQVSGNITGGTGLRVGYLVIPADGTLVKSVVLMATADVTGSWLWAENNVLNFGQSELNSSSDQTVNFKNRGTVNVTVSGLQASGTRFNLLSEDCTLNDGVIPPGGVCRAQVRFMPTRGGTEKGRLRLNSDSSVPVTVRLTGQGNAQRLERAPARLDFGLVSKGTTSAEEILALTNKGFKVLNFRDISVPNGPFLITSRTCGDALEPQASCTVTLVYQPPRRAVHRRRLTISSDDPNHPTLHAWLTGTGN